MISISYVYADLFALPFVAQDDARKDQKIGHMHTLSLSFHYEISAAPVGSTTNIKIIVALMLIATICQLFTRNVLTFLL